MEIVMLIALVVLVISAIDCNNMASQYARFGSYIYYPVTYVPPVNTMRVASTLVATNPEQSIAGKMEFRQNIINRQILVTINATGLPPGKHGVHVHEYGDLSEGCNSTGAHYRSILLGNIETKEDGVTESALQTPYVILFGSYGIVGRSIAIHDKPISYRDTFSPPQFMDFTPVDEEKALGEVIACGIITIQK